MTDLTISLNLPRDLLGALNIPESQLPQQILEILALDLFRQQRISAGKAAELLGISKISFIELLARHKICYFNETPDELTAEVEVVERLMES
jgi:predicted HTH domain antitoxin